MIRCREDIKILNSKNSTPRRVSLRRVTYLSDEYLREYQGPSWVSFIERKNANKFRDTATLSKGKHFCIPPSCCTEQCTLCNVYSVYSGNPKWGLKWNICFII